MGRGQTAHDYLIGVSIMLVVLFGIFAIIPTIYEPFQEPIGTEEEAMADRLGERIVSDHSVRGASNTLNYTRLENTMRDSGKFDTLLDRSGIPSDRTQVNVTLRELESPVDDLTKGLDDENRYFVNRSTAATTIRIVQFPEKDCKPVCRLIVRVW